MKKINIIKGIELPHPFATIGEYDDKYFIYENTCITQLDALYGLNWRELIVWSLECAKVAQEMNHKG